MSIAKKYIILEHVRPFIFGLFIFVFILFMGNMGDIISMLAEQEGELLTVLAILRNILIYVASFSIPMACLLSSLLAVGRFNTDNEITAMRACGMNPAGLMMPVILITALISLLSVRLNSEIVPKATTQTERMLADFAQREPSMFIQERMLIEDFQEHVIYIQRKRGDRLFGVQITQLRGEGFPVNITSREGKILETREPGTISIKLLNGTVDEADRHDPYTYSRSRFSEYYITLKLPGQETAGFRRRPKDMTTNELEQKARELISLNMDASPLLTEIQTKFAQSFSPLAFVLMAIPLSLKVKRGGKSVGFGMCLLVVIVFYVMFTAAQTLGERGIAHQTIVWAPNIMLSAAGMVMLLRQK